MSDEALIRIGSFFGVLFVMGVAESFFPRRILDAPKAKRWTANLMVSISSTLLARLLFPILPVGVAAYCAANSIGLLNLLSFPFWLETLIAILLLDMLIYWQHVIFHKNRMLWRLHRMHHADVDIDASTGVRFHPIEILASLAVKMAAILLLGPSVAAVVAFEVTLNGCALFNHANVRIPQFIDKPLRLLVVTPDMHRVHHSTDMREANMNFGFSFPWWDRIFGSYKAQPDLGHKDMHIGLNIFRDKKYLGFFRMLTIPFVTKGAATTSSRQ